MSTHDTPDTPNEPFENQVAKVQAEVQELANILGYLDEALNAINAILQYGIDSDLWLELERGQILYLKELEKCNDSLIVSSFFPDGLRYLFLAKNNIKEPNEETRPEEVRKIISAYIKEMREEMKETMEEAGSLEEKSGYEGIFEEDGTVVIPEGTQEENARADLFCELFSLKGIFPALAMVKKIPDDLARHDVLARGLYTLLQRPQVDLEGMKPFIQAMRDIKKDQGVDFSETEGERDAGAELLKKREANVLHVRTLAAYAVRLINESEDKFGELDDSEVFIDICTELEKRLEHNQLPGLQKNERFQDAFTFLKWKMHRDRKSIDAIWELFNRPLLFNRGDEANKELFSEAFSVEIDYSQSIKHMMEEAGIHYVSEWHADYETLFHYRMPKEGRFKIEMKLVPMRKEELSIDEFTKRVLTPERKGASFEHLLALAKKYPTIHEKIGIVAPGGKCFTESEGETPRTKAIPMYPVLGKATAPAGTLHKVISLTAEGLGGIIELENKDYAGLIIVSEEKI